MSNKSYAIVFGGGAYGSALASVVSNNVDEVWIKVRSEEVVNDLNEGKNERYLPGLNLPGNLRGFIDWEDLPPEMSDQCKILISAIPTGAINDFVIRYKDRLETFLQKKVPLVVLSKGIDPDVLKLSDDLFFDHFSSYKEYFAFLSGPSFAKEIVEKKITLVSLAGQNLDILKSCSKYIQTNYFNVFHSVDTKGVLLGGALKNVLAIAGGIAEGLGYLHNTRAALITMGIFDMLRIGSVYKANPETFYGLSGMGDLILTTTGGLSRNKSFGLELAKGRSANELLQTSVGVVEGYKTTLAVKRLTVKYKIKCPLFDGVYRVLYEGVDIQEEIERLMRMASKFNGVI